MPMRLLDRVAVSEGRFQRFLTALMAVGFLCLLAAGLAAGWSARRAQEHSFWVAHTYRVELGVADMRRLLEEAEAVRRGYLLAPGPSFVSAYAHAAGMLPQVLARVRSLTRDNPRQRANIAALQAMLEPQYARERRSFALVAAGRRDEAVAVYAAEVAQHPMTAIRARFDALAREERALLAIRDVDQRRSLVTFTIVLSVAGALLLGVAALSLLVVLRFTRDLTASRDSLRDLNETLEEQVASRTVDLTRANEEIQRFAYIVSHDLRSPLVNVMGFTAELEGASQSLGALVDRAEAEHPELVTQEARFAAREDLPEAIRFIRTSTQKMDRLINAILKLSREGRRVLTPERLDVAAIVGTVRDSLRHRLDDDGVAFAIEPPLPAVTSDRLAVEQILSNIIENAVKYLQPGRPGRIAVRGRREGAGSTARVVIEVEDNGRGIAAADHARVFDLFRRSGAHGPRRPRS